MREEEGILLLGRHHLHEAQLFLWIISATLKNNKLGSRDITCALAGEGF